MKKLLFFLLASTSLLAKSTICLNMIVKNEAHVIERCLASVKPLIDTWVIVDTGSSDGTQEVIRKYMEDMPGELHEYPWVDFATNRNQALELAKDKADYILIMDADDYLEYSDPTIFDHLTLDHYKFPINYAHIHYSRIQLIKSLLPWIWIGVVHEYIDCKQSHTGELLRDVHYIDSKEGGRSRDPQTVDKDLEVLRKALEKEPNHPRYLYYLGTTCRDAGLYDEAIEALKRRVAFGDTSNQEVYSAQYSIASMYEELGRPTEEIIDAYLSAFKACPMNVQPLLRLSRFLAQKEMYLLGYLVAIMGEQIPLIDELILSEPWMYEWGLKFEKSVCAYYLDRFEESAKLLRQVLEAPYLPEEVRPIAEYNLESCLQKIEGKK